MTLRKAIATPIGQPTLYVELTADEIIARDADQAANLLANRIARPQSLRDTKLYGAISINGISITPDDKTQNRLMAARIIAKEDPSYTVNWKTNSGYVVLDANTIIALADAIRVHIQKCFDAEKTIIDNIGKYDTLLEIETAYEVAYNA